MAGSVRERSPGRWELRVYVGLDPISGRKRWATKTVTAGSRKAAERQLASFVTEVDRAPARSGDMTLGRLLDQWIAVRGPDWSPRTLAEHRRLAGGYLAPLRPVPVHQLRTIDLDRFYARLRDHGGRAGAPLDPATVRRTHVVIRAALEQAVRWELIVRNPATNANPGTVEEAEVTPPTVDELARLLRAAEAAAPELAVFVIVAAVTGARRGALCALRWTDIDLDAGVIRFPRVLVIGPGGLVERPASRSKRSARAATIDPLTAAALTSHRDAMAKRAAALDIALGPDGFVFSDDPGGAVPWRPDSTSRRFRRARDAAGVPATVRLHHLRHFMATLALAGGIDVKTVATRGGWAQAATLLDRYAHVLEPRDRAAAELLGAAVHGTCDF